MIPEKDFHKISFRGVGLGLIFFGILLFSCSLAEWYIIAIGGDVLMAFPFFKAICGVIIIALGYIVLELELLRTK